jgi:hypothetical protein
MRWPLGQAPNKLGLGTYSHATRNADITVYGLEDELSSELYPNRLYDGPDKHYYPTLMYDGPNKHYYPTLKRFPRP